MIPFNSFKCIQFAKHYGFNFVPTRPHHPSSNGKAEKGIQIVKRMLKCYEKGEDAFLAILNYRSTPLDCGKSPAELLMNRQIKSRLPHAFFESQKQDRKIDSRGANKILKPLSEGQTVRMYDKNRGNVPQKEIVMNIHISQCLYRRQ